MRSEPIVEGTFTQHSMNDVLGLVGISRQCLDVVFDDAQTGMMTVKAGQLLDASAAGGVQGQDAFFSLYRRPGARFAVYRRDQDVQAMTSLGQLANLVESAQRRPSSRPPVTASGGAAASPPTPQQAQSDVRGANPERELIVQGRFADFPLNDVLSTLTLTRQTVEFILRDGKEPRGGILLKAGQILDARTKTTPSANAREAFADLIANPGDSFAIVRRASPPTNKTLGALSEWLADAKRVVPMPVRRVVLDGMMAQFPILDVFSVLSTSRQRMVLELWESGRPRGKMVVKAGMVLEVSTADQKAGDAALRAILQTPGDRFVVATDPSRSAMPPIGKLSEMLEQAASVQEPQPTATFANEQLLLEGQFTDFTIHDALSVLGLSRHCLELRVKPTYGGSTGAIVRVKAGQVLLASLDGERDPVRVFHTLLAVPSKSFSIVRIPTPPGAISLGTLNLLFQEAQTLDDAAATVIDLEAQDPSLREAPSLSKRRTTPSVVEDRPTLIPATAHGQAAFLPDPRIDALAQQLDSLERYVMDRQVEVELRGAVELLQILEKRIEELSLEGAKGGSRGSGDWWLTILVILVQLFTLLAVVAAVGLSVIPWNL